MQLQDQPDTYLVGFCVPLLKLFSYSTGRRGTVKVLSASLRAISSSSTTPLKRPVLTERASGRQAPSPTCFRLPSNTP